MSPLLQTHCVLIPSAQGCNKVTVKVLLTRIQHFCSFIIKAFDGDIIARLLSFIVALLADYRECYLAGA